MGSFEGGGVCVFGLFGVVDYDKNFKWSSNNGSNLGLVVVVIVVIKYW